MSPKGASLAAADFEFKDFFATPHPNDHIATKTFRGAADHRIATGLAQRENRAPQRAEPASLGLQRTVQQLRARLAEMERDHILATKRSAALEAQLVDRTAELERTRRELETARASAGSGEPLGGGSELSALRAQVRELSEALARKDGEARISALSASSARPHDLQLESKMYFKECVRLQQELAAVADERRAARRTASELASANEALELLRARERDRADSEALDGLARRAVLDQIDDAATALRREVGAIARFVGLPPDPDDEFGGYMPRGPTIDRLLSDAMADAEEVGARAAADRLRLQQHAELAELRAALDSREADREALEARAAMLESELDKPLLAAWRAPGLDADAAAARKRRAEQRRQASAATLIAARFLGRRARKQAAAERAKRSAALVATERERQALMAKYRSGLPAGAREPAPSTRAQIAARKAELAQLEGRTGARVPAGVPGGIESPSAAPKGSANGRLGVRERQGQLKKEVEALEVSRAPACPAPRRPSLPPCACVLRASSGAFCIRTTSLRFKALFSPPVHASNARAGCVSLVFLLAGFALRMITRAEPNGRKGTQPAPDEARDQFRAKSRVRAQAIVNTDTPIMASD